MRSSVIFLFVVLLTLLISGCSINQKTAPVDPLNPRFVEIKDISLVGTLTTTTMQELNFPQYWEEFFQQYNQSAHKKNNKFYGTMFWDEQDEMAADTPIHYLVGVPAKAIPKANVPWEKHTIKGGLYAVFTHQGPVDSIFQTYSYIYGVWLPQAEYKERAGDQFEYYDERFKDQSPDSIIEIWVPVQKK